MGYMRHHGILVTSFSKEIALAAYHKAEELFPSEMLSDIKESFINKYYNFAVFPDCSKEEWLDSDKQDVARNKFIKYLKGLMHEDNSTPVDWILVQYGDDENEPKIIADSDELVRKEGYK